MICLEPFECGGRAPSAALLRTIPSGSLHAFVIDVPALGSEQSRDSTIAVAAIEAGQADDRRRQGKVCEGRTPMQTLVDGKRIWKEKFVS